MQVRLIGVYELWRLFYGVLIIECRSDLPYGCDASVSELWPYRLSPFTALQMALLVTLHWTADGLVSARAQNVVVAEPRPERAAILRLGMAARVV